MPSTSKIRIEAGDQGEQVGLRGGRIERCSQEFMPTSLVWRALLRT
jgi:hypothetical protein